MILKRIANWYVHERDMNKIYKELFDKNGRYSIIYGDRMIKTGHSLVECLSVLRKYEFYPRSETILIRLISDTRRMIQRRVPVRESSFYINKFKDKISVDGLFHFTLKVGDTKTNFQSDYVFIELKGILE